MLRLGCAVEYSISSVRPLWDRTAVVCCFPSAYAVSAGAAAAFWALPAVSVCCACGAEGSASVRHVKGSDAVYPSAPAVFTDSARPADICVPPLSCCKAAVCTGRPAVQLSVRAAASVPADCCAEESSPARPAAPACRVSVLRPAALSRWSCACSGRCVNRSSFCMDAGRPGRLFGSMSSDAVSRWIKGAAGSGGCSFGAA